MNDPKTDSGKLTMDLASTLLDASLLDIAFEDQPVVTDDAGNDAGNEADTAPHADSAPEPEVSASEEAPSQADQSQVSQELGDSPSSTERDAQPEREASGQPKLQDVSALVEELRKKLRESEIMEYARQQGELIDREIRQLAAAGVRITKEEAQMIIKEAFERGIEPYVYFKAYAADLLRNTLLFGEPLSDRPIRAAHIQRGDAPHTPPPIERRSLEERFRRPDGMISLDYFVAESMNNVVDTYPDDE